ncbi:hypothetical protein C8R45DRAFT_392961 [Mycena sanguinolenta]|nr:hypothetical protein C8R45DRAFT_392961 [Mycena sanguinolenta]
MSRRIYLKSMATTLLLSDLPADIVLSIFAWCDIASVVSVAQTCRCLHALAFEKSVWIVLLGDLRRRCILDRNCTPNLETLSTAEMIEVVKRLITGPQSWNPGELDSVAEIPTKITLRPTIDPQTLRWSIAKLLPSGRYLLFSNMKQLECWSVANNSLVWTYTSDDMALEEVAVEETDTDVTIMLCVHTYPDGEPGPKFIEMVKLYFQTMTHTSLLIAFVPDHTETFSHPLIRGALAVVSLNMDAGKNLYMILNPEQKSYCILQGADRDNVYSGPCVAFIPDHVLLSEQDRLHLISSNTLDNHWARTNDPLAQFFPVLVKDIPKLRTFEVSDVEQSFREIYVHESLTRDGDYSFWIYGASRMTDRGALLSYRLSIPPHGDPQWCRRIQSVVEPGQVLERFYQAVTYGGHRLYSTLIPEHTIFSAALPLTSPRTVLVQLPPDLGPDIDIAPYSGALTYCTESSVEIQYYCTSRVRGFVPNLLVLLIT